jgi:hypothetical protein
MSKLTDLLDEYRALLMRRDRVLTAQLGREYAAIAKALREQLQAVLQQQRGSVEWRDVKAERLNDLLAQVEARIQAWAKAATPKVTAAQMQAAALGAEFPGALANTVGLRASLNVLPASAFEAAYGTAADGTPLGDLFDRIGPGVRLMWQSRLALGIARGDNPVVVARDLSRSTAVGFARASAIARTEMLRAYRYASRETALANPRVFDGWVWAASLSGRTCVACLAMHGSRHSMREPFTDHPNGRCQAVYTIGTHLPADEVKRQLPDADSWLGSLSDDELVRAIGKGRADLYRAGSVGLAKFATLVTNATWGDTYQPTPLALLKKM